MENITVSEWNNIISESLIPNIVILTIYVILGTCGNVLVLLVYSFQMKESSDERYFIPILAAFDMIATIYCGIFMIIQSLYQVIFTHNILCKTAQFFIGFTTYIPVLLLLIIAIQRYMKLCRPLKPAMPLHVKRTTLILAIVISFLGALPLPYIYGSIPFHSITYGSIGRRCGKVKEGHRLVRAIYAIVIGVFAVALVTALIVLYSKIGCTVYRKLKMNRSKSSEVEFRNSVSKTDEDGVSGSEYSDGTQNTLDSKISNSNIVKIDKNCKEQQLEKKQQTTTSQPVGSTKRRKDNRSLTHKLTVMFFVITLVFIFSYLPKVILLLVEGLDKDFWENVSNTERPGWMFLYQIFVINNIVNPFIYAFMDIKFRKEATVFLKRFFQCTF
ncbi:Hypothetical predicted protein [Mytilus galloprovincialis]|uniref:G-protein coupled receptors family 1 profile domain-containing protein n=2 Tax=Mytilus galloprovincialis TaxID=29158 RepID=A0A8B6GBG5_MYTGA|nr:Hypothetical predicted protein [Mytilus galloprovincialis]